MNIVILTNFQDLNPHYSLTGLVRDQVLMMHRHGHQVHLVVSQGFAESRYTGPAGLVRLIPNFPLKDYSSGKKIEPGHRREISRLADLLEGPLAGMDVALTHDWVFSGWNLPFFLAVGELAPRLPHLAWLHWIHSVPTQNRDWWNLDALGSRHHLAYPNRLDSIRVAEQFRTSPDRVRVIPHIKDLRSWFDFDPETCVLMDRFPGLVEADVVQILPASVDRLEAKGVAPVIKIFGEIKKKNRSVFLMVVTPWADIPEYKDRVIEYRKIALAAGLKVGSEVVFSADFTPALAAGLPQRMMRELFQCANLFIFPTREESFGLVVPEAVLAGGVLPVLNRSLAMQMEIAGLNALFLDFGSYCQTFRPPDDYWNQVAALILSRMDQCEAVRAKTFVRQHYNWDALYRRAYEPTLTELVFKAGGWGNIP